MSDDKSPTVPSLSSDVEEVTPPARPPMSRSQQRRAAVQQTQTVTVRPAASPVPDVSVQLPPSDQIKLTIEPAGMPSYPRWRVLEDTEVPRGASTFQLRREQVLSEQHYDVGALIAQGVKLERVAE